MYLQTVFEERPVLCDATQRETSRLWRRLQMIESLDEKRRDAKVALILSAMAVVFAAGAWLLLSLPLYIGGLVVLSAMTVSAVVVYRRQYFLTPALRQQVDDAIREGFVVPMDGRGYLALRSALANQQREDEDNQLQIEHFTRDLAELAATFFANTWHKQPTREDNQARREEVEGQARTLAGMLVRLDAANN